MKLLTTTSLVLAIIVHGPTNGQVTFNIHQDDIQAGLSGRGTAIRKTDAGYLLLCGQGAPETGDQYHIFTRELNGFGIMTAEIQFDAGQSFDHVIGTVGKDRNGDGDFLLPVNERMNYVDTSWLYTINVAGERTGRQALLTFPPEDSVRHSFHGVAHLGDEGSFLGGELYRPAWGYRGYIARVDAGGEVQWTRNLYQMWRVLDVAARSEDELYVTGWRNAHDRGVLARLDASGQVVWMVFNGGSGSGTSRILLTDDGHIVTIGTHVENSWADDQIMLSKWTSDGDLIWSTLSNSNWNVGASDIEVLPNGDFIAVGMHYADGWLARFNATGDSLWTRRYHILGDEHYFNDVELTSDGGFIMTGTAWRDSQEDPDIQTQQVIWIVKTDSMGCLVPGCHTVGVQEFESQLQSALQLSPNPAHERVQVSLALPEGYRLEGAVQALLLDAQGKEVLREQVPTKTTELRGQLDVSGLSPGLYYLHLRDAAKWLAGRKVVME